MRRRARPTFVEANAALVREAARLLGEPVLPLARELGAGATL